MIFDTFLYNGEHELVEARVHEWDPVANVQHVSLSFGMTFQGAQQRVPMPPMLPRLSRLGMDTLDGESPWHREGAARDQLGSLLMLGGIGDDDIVLYSDGDEIVRAGAFEAIRNAVATGPVGLPAPQHYYDLTHIVSGGETRARAALWRDIKDQPFRFFADSRELQGLYGASWHYSMLGGPERVLAKLLSFSHLELQEPGWVTLDNVRRLIAEHLDVKPFDPRPLEAVANTAPAWLTEQAQTRWPYLLDALLEST